MVSCYQVVVVKEKALLFPMIVFETLSKSQSPRIKLTARETCQIDFRCTMEVATMSKSRTGEGSCYRLA